MGTLKKNETSGKTVLTVIIAIVLICSVAVFAVLQPLTTRSIIVVSVLFAVIYVSAAVGILKIIKNSKTAAAELIEKENNVLDYINCIREEDCLGKYNAEGENALKDIIGNTLDVYRKRNSDLEDENGRLLIQCDAADKSKGLFMSNMSHEIKTPMNGIIGMTELLYNTYLSEEQREYLNTIKESNAQLMNIINDILDYTKMNAGEVRLTETIFDIRTSLNRLIFGSAKRCEAKGITFRVNINSNLPDYVSGDNKRFEQAIEKLIDNAIKFTSKGCIELLIDKISENQNGILIKITVKDTGTGIPESMKELVFNKFIQADASYTRRYGGVGLGLAIVKHLVKLMNGEIWFDSRVDEGTEFYFTAWFKKASEDILE